MERYRYTINIIFKTNRLGGVTKLVADVKTIQEVREYKDLPDKTVNRAWVDDNVTGKKIIWKE